MLDSSVIDEVRDDEFLETPMAKLTKEKDFSTFFLKYAEEAQPASGSQPSQLAHSQQQAHHPNQNSQSMASSQHKLPSQPLRSSQNISQTTSQNTSSQHTSSVNSSKLIMTLSQQPFEEKQEPAQQKRGKF